MPLNNAKVPDDAARLAFIRSSVRSDHSYFDETWANVKPLPPYGAMDSATGKRGELFERSELNHPRTLNFAESHF